MPSFPDSIFLFVLALLLFGPKRLPVLARELGKWVGEFRRASNEFKMQMEDELRLSEQAERNKQIAAMEAAAPVTPAIAAPVAEGAAEGAADGVGEVAEASLGYEVVDGVKTPLPIAVSGDLKIMPPQTGLPVAQEMGPRNSALKGLLDALPAGEPEAEAGSEAAVEAESHPMEQERSLGTPETTAHGN